MFKLNVWGDTIQLKLSLIYLHQLLNLLHNQTQSKADSYVEYMHSTLEYPMLDAIQIGNPSHFTECIFTISWGKTVERNHIYSLPS